MENHKIRFVILTNAFNQDRVKLVEKISPLNYHLRKVHRPGAPSSDRSTPCLEGFLENKDRLEVVVRRLTDKPIIIYQPDTDHKTWLIEDGEKTDLVGVPD